jgi:hypothetical protein
MVGAPRGGKSIVSSGANDSGIQLRDGHSRSLQNGAELSLKILLPSCAGEVDHSAGIEKFEALLRKFRFQYPANVRLDQNQWDRAIRH